jgi:hypothetical protein
MMVGDPEDLSSEERHALQRAVEACPDVPAIHPLVQRFADMVRSREAGEFEGWLEDSLVRRERLRDLRDRPAAGAASRGGRTLVTVQ